MKILIGVLLATSFICMSTSAQSIDQRQTDNPAPQQRTPPQRTWIELLMLSQPQQQTDDGKSNVEQANPQRKFDFGFSIQFVVIDGAVFTVFDDKLSPWPGGGASGCFDPTGVETATRIERARAEWAKRSKKD